MTIHSMGPACSCWNWGEKHNKPMRDVYRRTIAKSGHAEGCPKHPLFAPVSLIFGETHKPLKRIENGLCCYVCNGNRKVSSATGELIACSHCNNGQMLSRHDWTRRFRRERHDHNARWRKWSMENSQLELQTRLKWDRRRGLEQYKAWLYEHLEWERAHEHRRKST